MFSKTLIVAAALAALATAHDARAAWPYLFRHTAPALGCQIGYGEGSGVYWHDGGLYSDATGWWRTALCPITAYFAGATDVTVSAVDMSYDQDVSCRMMARSTSDGWTGWGAATNSVGTNPSPQRLSLAAVWAGTVSNTHYVLCYLPPVYSGNRSGVVAYEFNAVDRY